MAHKLFSTLVAVGAVAAEAINQKPMAPQGLSLEGYTCTHPPYKIHIFSKSPLVIYIENFITAEERSHLHAVALVF